MERYSRKDSNKGHDQTNDTLVSHSSARGHPAEGDNDACLAVGDDRASDRSHLSNNEELRNVDQDGKEARLGCNVSSGPSPGRLCELTRRIRTQRFSETSLQTGETSTKGMT